MAIVLLPQTARAGMDDHDVSITVGYVQPIGSTEDVLNDGPSFSVRFVPNRASGNVFTPMLDAGFTRFKATEDTLSVTGEIVTQIFIQNQSQFAFNAHVGAQFGWPKRTGLFRPRAALGIGPYFLRLHNLERSADGTTVNNIQTDLLRLGWRGIIGADFFFTKKWGLGLEYVYDDIFEVPAGHRARYHGLSLALVVPFGE